MDDMEYDSDNKLKFAKYELAKLMEKSTDANCILRFTTKSFEDKSLMDRIPLLLQE